MRPVKLKLKGFTSFREEQELDFRELDVFAITGPTGAGKSSLLDAITYALYGKVERVGDQCGQLVSKGMPRMAVELEFEVDRNAYRVSRTTPAITGPTKILLERKVDGAWQSYGEGADRVRDVERMITQLLGLDYSGFTRSVLLPQGKFAEFMVGDRKDRRRLLSDLLGLDLFTRMAQRAGSVASQAQGEADIRDRLLATEYAGVTPEALEAKRAEAEEAAQLVQRLAHVADRVAALDAQWRQEQERAVELRGCAAELHDWSKRILQAVAAFEGLASQLSAKQTELASSESAVAVAQTAADASRAAVESAESTWGTALELARAESNARRLPGLAQQLEARQAEIGEVEARRPTREATLQQHTANLAAAEAALEQAEADLDSARQHEEAIKRANMAAALASTVQIGDPCPVCGEPITRLPDHPTSSLSDASRATKQADKALSVARQALSDSQRQLDATQRDIQDDTAALSRLAADLAQRRVEHITLADEVAAALRGPLPADPAQVIAERIAHLARLAAETQASTSALTAATAQHRDLTQAVALLEEKLRNQRAAIDDPAQSLVERTQRLTSTRFQLPTTPALDAPTGEVLDSARRKAESVAAAAISIETRCQQLAARESELLEQAHAAVGCLVEPATSLEDLVQRVGAAHTGAAIKHATATQEVATLVQRLAKRDELSAEIAQLRHRAGVYETLANDLRANRLIDFLLDEALDTLALTASHHLSNLSDSRYTLRSDRDFWVVDRWNGEEERSVRTLSGGETFLASLSLALALSEQVRSLSITERARLDSLFLDEGFGTLDPDTLKVVTDALEQLGGGGRLVGAITHVRELAENFPRVEVEKSPRGSRLRVIAA